MITTVLRERAEPQRWRNGGGVTRELLAWPDANDWSLRVSVAEIEADGPFSAYPGVERWFAVVDGTGVVLGGIGTRLSLTGDSEPIRFDGDREPHCTLLAGPTRDLNLMARKQAGAGSMLRVLPATDWSSAASFRAVYTAAPALLTIDDADVATLPAHSLTWSAGGTGRRWRLTANEPLRAWWLGFEPRR